MEKIIFPNATGIDRYNKKEIREKRGILSNQNKIKEIKSITGSITGAGDNFPFYSIVLLELCLIFLFILII
ncbi:hypothetical protein KAR28_01785 [Candidatus Parcubacteria bacterium]|nr:hypothetical protein [Candidatus Parcubacteria bacterium]